MPHTSCSSIFGTRIVKTSGKKTMKGLPAGRVLRTAQISGLSVLVLWIVATVPAYAARTILYYENECCRYITEGEFAVLYVEGLKLGEPAQGWTVQSAAAALSSLGHQPQGGWVLSRYLSESVMARLLRNSPFFRKPFSDPAFQKSDALVTIAGARSALPGDEGLTQGEFAVLLAEALKIPGPSSGWSTGSAIAALTGQRVPIQPAAGWKQNAQLRESDMLQILVPTRFRPTSLDPSMKVSTLQAYSLLFGKFEIATEGHFGLFVVTALGAPAPPGGWTQEEALRYIKERFGVDSGYGWNASAPLCAKTFDQALRRIIEQLQATAPVSQQASSAGPQKAGSPKAGVDKDQPTAQESTGRSGAPSEEYLKSIRRNGLIPSDQCAIIPAQGLLSLRRGESPCTDCVPPPPPTPLVPPPF
ncbi:MAG TPA: hypothetical protein VE398_07735 [Acidobacteriota bacterium]|nr:hypothetical protein [Acidobacteriota bacterium]